MGEDKEKEFVKNGKWYWKVDRNEEVKAKLAKFFLVLGKSEGQSEIKEPHLQPSSKKTNQIFQQIKQFIQAKILSVKKTGLTDFLRVFYFDKAGKKKGYFLLNDYQHPEVLPNLSIGSVRNICLVNGRKHSFFSGMRLKASILNSISAG